MDVFQWQAIGAQVEFYKILKLQKEALEAQKLIEEEHHKLKVQNREEIFSQIREKEEKRKQELREKYAEGERLKQALRVEKLRLQDIKARKLKELEKWGVPPKYQVDLKKLKVGLPWNLDNPIPCKHTRVGNNGAKTLGGLSL